MLLLGGLFDRETIVLTFPVVIATCEDIEALQAASNAEEHCSHSVLHARQLDQVMQTDVLIGSIGRRLPAGEVREAAHSRACGRRRRAR